MIRIGIMAAALVALPGCDQTQQSGTSSAPDAPLIVDRRDTAFETTAALLAADRARLDQVRAACKANAPEATPDLCEAAAEATRRRFRGEGNSYRPRNVDPFPTTPALSNYRATVPNAEAPR